jgi:hypothetical protein
MDGNTTQAADGNDRCTYCGAEVPAPVELHHHESECRPSAERTRDLFVVFDGPPSHESGRFVELQDAEQRGVGGVAEWTDRGDGYWTLGPFRAVRASALSAFRAWLGAS